MAKKHSQNKVRNSRRITKAEAEKLGVKYSKKLRTTLPNGHAPRSTKTLISEREWISAKNQGKSKEKVGRESVRKKSFKEYKKTVHYQPLSYTQMVSLIRQAIKEGFYKFVQFTLLVSPPTTYKRQGDEKGVWITTNRAELENWEELLQDAIDEFSDEGEKPASYGVIFYKEA